MKRSGLTRTSMLRRAAMKSRRTPIAPRSAKTIAAASAHDIIRAQVYARDRVCQVHRLGLRSYAVGPCYGPLTPHHRRKASQGGGYSTDNLVAACLGHNEALEYDVGLMRWARTVGLVVTRGDPEWERLGG